MNVLPPYRLIRSLLLFAMCFSTLLSASHASESPKTQEVDGFKAITLRTANAFYAQSSRLSTGKWRKIRIDQSGLYKITWKEIKAMGFSPEKVQVYGYGGALLSENFRLNDYADDLPPVPMWQYLGSDGVFNAGDYLVFYAQGTVSWVYDATLSIYTRQQNPYSDHAYYFLGERLEGSLLADTLAESGSPTAEVETFTERFVYENDYVNLGESVAGSGTGRELYGEDFVTNPIQTFSFDLVNPDTTQYGQIQVDFAGRNSASQTCLVYANGTSLYSLYMGWISESNQYTYATRSNRTGSFKPSGTSLTVKLQYNSSGSKSDPRAHLNYLVVNYPRRLIFDQQPLEFQAPKSVSASAVLRYSIRNATAQTVVLDITQPLQTKQMSGVYVDGRYRFTASGSVLRRFVAFDPTSPIPSPIFEGGVPNQNIHGTGSVDMVILSPQPFLTQANRLAKAHQEADGLRVLVVTPEQVYNEFSSGTPDATAYRRMMKFFYDTAQQESDKPDYLLLFGGGIYDNRKSTSTAKASSKKSNHLLTYQSSESLEGTLSYVTDDYFGFLDDTEGANLAVAKVDIGIGRFPVHTLEQATIAVDKTLSYMANRKKGNWKNKVLYLADDGDNNVHVSQANQLATSVETNHPQFMVHRIFVDAYQKEILPSGPVVPGARARFSELLESGLLMLNYSGHGSTTEWTEENLLLSTDIPKMNHVHLPLWVTATCDFTRFDAIDFSGGEQVFLNPNGGAIAMLTTTRIVYSNDNFIFNRIFSDNLFSKSNGERQTLGDLMRITKNASDLSGNRNKLSFTLIGDPALRLSYPDYTVRVTAVNDQPIGERIDTFSALQRVRIAGEILKEDGTVATDFNGLIYPTVLDATTTVQTLGSGGQDVFQYNDQSKLLFSGVDRVIDGLYSFEFVVPLDMSYSFKNGKISFYAADDDLAYEAQGVFKQFVLGGTYATQEVDVAGPSIRLFLNDTSFVSGGRVNQTPTLIAKISDSSGLNTTGSGIGHDLVLVVDNDPSQTYVLNSYYTADIQSYMSGTVQYVLPELTPGKHTLWFRAWDVRNNSGTAEIECVVESGQTPVLHTLQHANVGGTVHLVFGHNRPESPMTLDVKLYDLMGRLVWKESQWMQTGQLQSDVLVWPGTDLSGRRLAPGLFIVRVQVTDSSGASSVISEKIKLLAQ